MKGRRRTLKVFSDKNNQSLERSDGLSSPTMVCSWVLADSAVPNSFRPAL
jgi:hypothetical protein